MIRIFDRAGDGAGEIVNALGLISSDIDFRKWEPVLQLGAKEVTAIVGDEPIEFLEKFYQGDAEYDPDDEPALQEALGYAQQAIALFTWLRVIPTLDAQHDGAGRQRRLGENEKGLTALQEFKDEENIRRMAYEAVDALISVLDREQFLFWTESRKYRLREGLFIRSKEEFDEYFHIGSHRLFLTLLPIMREVQESDVEPVIGYKYLLKIIKDEDPKIISLIKTPSARAVALLTMQKAIERLPVEVLPEGIVQIQQSQPVNSRLRAEQQARAAVAASLAKDAAKNLERVQSIIAQLENNGVVVDDSYYGPIAHSKGMTF